MYIMVEVTIVSNLNHLNRVQENKWRKYAAPKGVVTPKGRRSHTAIVFQESMYIYGGYQEHKIIISVR